MLHFIDDDRPIIFSRCRDALCPGSVLALNQGSSDHDDPVLAESVRATERGYRGIATPVVLRDRAQIGALLDGVELVPPGLVDPVHWPVPTPDAEPIGAYAAVGRIPESR